MGEGLAIELDVQNECAEQEWKDQSRLQRGSSAHARVVGDFHRGAANWSRARIRHARRNTSERPVGGEDL